MKYMCQTVRRKRQKAVRIKIYDIGVGKLTGRGKENVVGRGERIEDIGTWRKLFLRKSVYNACIEGA